jgi:hypothetical protein
LDYNDLEHQQADTYEGSGAMMIAGKNMGEIENACL